MHCRQRLRLLTVGAAALVAATASADFVYVSTPGPNNLDLLDDGVFVTVGVDGTSFDHVSGVIGTTVTNKLFESIYTWSDSVVNINGALFFGSDLQAHETSTINYQGGENPFLTLVTFDDATINFSGGTVGFIGTGGGDEFSNGGSANITGGVITQNISCAKGSIFMSGGQLLTPDYGLPYSFLSFVPAGVTFSGNAVEAEWIGIESGNGFDGNIWKLSGTLNDGSSLEGFYMVDVGIFDPTIIVNYAGVTIKGTIVVNYPPVADAGADFSVDEGQLVTLDGTASSDPDGDSISYSWAQLPGGTAVSLSGANTATPSFTSPSVAPGGETLSFELTVTAGGDTRTDTVSVTVVNINHPPVAHAGDDQSVAEGAPVTLHGETSFDIDGDAITYQWVQTGGTPVVMLNNADTAMPTFVAPTGSPYLPGGLVAQLTFELRVDDGYNADAPAPGYELGDVVDMVVVNVTNINNAPTAEAGPCRVVNENVNVSLNGTASTDPDGDTLSYTWVQIGGPSVSLSGASTATPSFVAPWVNSSGANLTFRLTVNDGFGGTATDTVLVKVRNVTNPPRCDDAYASICKQCDSRGRRNDGCGHDDEDDDDCRERPCRHQNRNDCGSNVIWPPDHSMVNVCIMGIKSKSDNTTITITGIYQDEPTNGCGDGDTPVDAVIRPDGSVLVRAERSGNGNGRVYHIKYTATNPEGSCSGTVKLKVPKASKNGSCVDGGAIYNSRN